MSSKRTLRRTPSRRGRKHSLWMSAQDSSQDSPSLLAFCLKNQPKRKRKTTPAKRITRAQTIQAAAEVITVDNSPESAKMVHSVNSKFGNFMQSGSFVSSDDDEEEMIKAKINKKLSPNPFFISDDSDDDCKVIKTISGPILLDSSTPSTSAGTSNNLCKAETRCDVLEIDDSVLDIRDNDNSLIKDIKSLDEYRKETEEMLKNAASLLDEIKMGPKPEAPIDKKESPEKVTVGACPVCLDSLANRPAAVTICGHIFCKECIMQTAQALKKCPTCRKAITTKKIHPIYF